MFFIIIIIYGLWTNTDFDFPFGFLGLKDSVTVL